MRARLLLLLSACLSALACGDGTRRTPATVGLAPTILFPHGLLDKVTSLSVNVFETVSASVPNGVACNATSGTVTGTMGQTAVVSQTFNAATPGSACAMMNAKFCGTIQLPESANPRVFQVLAALNSTQPVANGCAQKTINQDSQSLTIKMIRVIPTAMCGNGIVEPTETCDPGSSVTDPGCSMCQTSETLLSVGSMATGTVNGKAGDKTNPSFAWQSATSGGEFLGAFTDKSQSNLQVSMAVEDPFFTPNGIQAMAVKGSSFFLPNGLGFPPPQTANSLENPAVAVLGSKAYIAFDNDSGGTFDIHLRSMDAVSLTPDQGPPQCYVNGSGGEPGKQSTPAIAAGNGGLYVAWQDDDQQAIYGRTYSPGGACGTLGMQIQLSSGSSQHARVAATATGWVVAWESGMDVKLRILASDGTTMGPEQVVQQMSTHTGLQDHPSVAAPGNDGRFAVAWTDHGTSPASVYLQRFDTTGTAIPGDQVVNAKLNNLSTSANQVTPVIAAVGTTGYVVAWVDSGTGHVRARLPLLDGPGSSTGGSLADSTGYLFNTVTGFADEFQVSVGDGRVRANPTIAVGGQGPFIAFGWEDQTQDTQAGVVARRFPVPTP